MMFLLSHSTNGWVGGGRRGLPERHHRTTCIFLFGPGVHHLSFFSCAMVLIVSIYFFRGVRLQRRCCDALSCPAFKTPAKAMAPKKVIPERDPDQAIEDWLNLTGLLYEQHKETLRVQTIEDELRDVHKKPQIDAESKHICRHDNRDVLLRMKQKDRELNTKKDQLRARKADKEPQYSFHPTISKHALAKNRKNQYQINTDWAEARKKRINAEKEKVQADEEKENQKEFEVSGRSRSLANKMERGGMSIEDWLIATDKQKKMKLWYAVLCDPLQPLQCSASGCYPV